MALNIRHSGKIFDCFYSSKFAKNGFPVQTEALLREPWFHDELSRVGGRKEAEELLIKYGSQPGFGDGTFLVRHSSNSWDLSIKGARKI